jgi:ABC-2 type transport system ATP-binding protein
MERSDPIRVVGLEKRYGRKLVLTGLDLTVPEGSTTALLGRNGAGKSTFIQILTGLLPRNAGAVHVLGLDPARRATAVKARVGYVPEVTPFHPRWRVAHALELSRAFRKRTWDRREEARLLEVFGLSPRERIGSLSKGYRAKLALLLALAHRPRLLLLDEPASGLDPVVRREVLASLVDAIHGEGRTVLLSSHLMEDVERLADRVAFLSGGRIVLEGEAEEVRSRGRNLESVFLDLLGREGAPRPEREEVAC